MYNLVELDPNLALLVRGLLRRQGWQGYQGDDRQQTGATCCGYFREKFGVLVVVVRVISQLGMLFILQCFGC